ncbi:MAG TPA: PAS domain S-box protein [Thermodesulfobacteriota bacterium]|nr:PAS domain S-box protein [Thermodesulfobacteriota bacterium]
MTHQNKQVSQGAEDIRAVDSNPTHRDQFESMMYHKRSVVKIGLFMGIPLMGALAIMNLTKGMYSTAFLNCAMFLIIVLLYFLTTRTVDEKSEYKIYSILFRLFAAAVGITLLYEIGFLSNFSRIEWSYIYPILVFFAVGVSEGMIWVSVFYGILGFFLLRFDLQKVTLSEMQELRYRFLISFFVVSMLSLFLEHAFRRVQQRLLNHQRDLRESENRYRQAYEHLNIQMEERKQAEAALRESEDRYRDLVECSHYLICTHDLQGQILSVNQEGAKLLGYSQKDFLKKNIRDLLVPEFAHEFSAYINTIQRQGAASGLMSLRTAGGENRIWEYHNTLRTEGVPSPIVRAMSHDVTERIQGEQAVKRLSQENAVMAEIGRIISSTLETDEVYAGFAEAVRHLIDFDRIAICIIDVEHQTGTVAYETGNEMPGRGLGEVFPLSQSVYEHILKTRSGVLVQTEGTSEMEERYPFLVASFRTGFRSAISVPLISKDQVIGGLNLRSFKPNAYTERDLRIAESIGIQIAGAIANALLFAEHKRTEEALRASERKFRDLYDHAPLGYHEYDAKGCIINVNRTDLQMLGYTAEEMIGRPIWKLNVNEDAARAQVMAKLTGTLPPGKQLERTYRKKDGTTFPVLIEDRLILDEEGAIKGIRCMIQDITERKRIEEALREKTEELARSNKDLEQFAYVASHDLQEPLRMVTSYVQLLAKRYEGKLGSEADEFIDFAVDGAVRMRKLINDLLTYSRVGTQGKKLSPTDSEAVLALSLNDLRLAIEENGALVTHDPLPRVIADHFQLGQLFQNLIGNAIKFRSNEPPRVHLSASRNGNGWTFSVRDNGIGIAAEYSERIFVIFQRLHSRKEYAGTGIGLAICKKIVERHGGRIWVESEVGKGATFCFILPAVKTEPLSP